MLLYVRLLDTACRCLMNLTQPARIVFKNEVPQDQSTRHCYIQVEEYLQEYKQVCEVAVVTPQVSSTH